MPIGVLTDVHGNTAALDAVVADARSVGVDRWWLLGDLVAMGPDPVGALETLRDLEPEVCISGNTERYLLTDELPFPPAGQLDLTAKLVDQMVETAASLAWTRGAIGETGCAWLAGGVAFDEWRRLDGTRVVMVHASAGRDDGPGLSRGRTDVEIRDLFPDVEADLVLAGHTHEVTDRVVGSVRFVNPGSVSNHMSDDRRANYLVVLDHAEGHALEFRSVDYAVDRVVEQLERCRIPSRRFLLQTYFGR